MNEASYRCWHYSLNKEWPVALAAVLSVLVIAWLIYWFTGRTRPSKPADNTSGLRVDMAPLMARIRTQVLGAYYCWGALYVAAFLRTLCSEDGQTSDWRLYCTLAMDLSQNASSVFLLGVYHSLTSSRKGPHYDGHSLLSSPSPWLLLFSALFCYELIASLASARPNTDPEQTFSNFRLLYGLGQAAALYLLAGRLESTALREHLAFPPSAKGTATWAQRCGPGLTYMYASIQPFYPVLGGDDPSLTSCLMILALVFKSALIGWLKLLLDQPIGSCKPSGLEMLAYEMQRFSAEDGSSFESSFLRKHFPAEYHHRLTHKEMGYLGIDYARMNAFKCAGLGLPHLESGMLVKHIFARTGAMRAGLRRGDIIVVIDGRPIGTHHRLSKVLAGSKAGHHVTIEALRRADPARKPASPGDYSLHRFQIELVDYHEAVSPKPIPERAPRLGRILAGGGLNARAETDGWTMLYNSVVAGVACTYRRFRRTRLVVTALESTRTGRLEVTTDMRLLRIAIDDLAPGDTARLHLHQDPMPEYGVDIVNVEVLSRVRARAGARPRGLFRALAMSERSAALPALLLAYPDRFVVDGFAPRQFDEVMRRDKLLHILCFDESKAVRYECLVRQGDTLRRTFPKTAWEQLRTETTLFFVANEDDFEPTPPRRIRGGCLLEIQRRDGQQC